MTQYFNRQVLETFEQLTRQYSRLFPLLPLKGEYFESLVYDSLRRHHPKSAVKWKPGSHQIGRDVVIDDHRMSMKSTRLGGGDVLEFSSYRTTSLKTLTEKIAFMAQSHFDQLLCLARVENDPIIDYRLLDVACDISYGDLAWCEDAINYTGVKDDTKVTIRKSRSDQVLITLPMSSATTLATFEIEVHGASGSDLITFH